MAGISVERMYVECLVCGFERKVFVSECRFCVLHEEVNALKDECTWLREQLNVVRGAVSVRAKEVRPRIESGVIGSMVDGARSVRRPRISIGGDQCVDMSEDGWVTVRNSKSGKGKTRDIGVGKGKSVVSGERSTEPIAVSNRFSSLGELGEGVAKGRLGGSVNVSRMEGNVRTRGGREGNARNRGNRRMTEVLVVGDSQIRYLDRKLSASEWEGERVCLPGAGVQDVCERYDRIVTGCAEDAVVIMHVGVNDVKKMGTCELRQRYRRLIERMSRSRVKGVVSGVLPRLDVGVEWLSRAVGLNEFVKGLCRELDLVFVDVWDGFYGNRSLYAMDGLHLSRAGVEVLWGELDSVVRSLQAGN